MPKKPRKKARDARLAELRELIRNAAMDGTVAAIEHCGNFWGVSNDYKLFIERRMEEHGARLEEQATALMAAVRTEVRTAINLELNRKRKRPR